MANAVFIQNPVSVYKDRPGIAYHFPRRYLRTVEACVGDWVLFYEGRKGRFGYTAIQRVAQVTEDPDMAGHYYAWLDEGSLQQFEQVVGRADGLGRAWEASLRGAGGRPISGGANTSAVRRISAEEFNRIASAGLAPILDEAAIPRSAELAEPPADWAAAPADRLRGTRLVNRAERDERFRRIVLRAYRGRCAMSGLDLRNGGGKMEAQAAHVKPVSANGPDVVTNGLALSGTLHWMFDRGLVSVADDHTILVSGNKVPRDVADRLIVPDRRLRVPDDPRDRPHPAYLAYHRETVFGAGAG